MNLLDEVHKLLAETPKYMSHITIYRGLLEQLLEKINALQKQVDELTREKR